MPQVEAQKLYEVQKYVSMSNHQMTYFWVLVNREKWIGLPRNLQNIMRKHVNAGALLQRNDIALLEKSVRERLTGRGMAFNEVDIASFRTKLKVTGFYSRWRDTWGSSAWSELENYSGPLK